MGFEPGSFWFEIQCNILIKKESMYRTRAIITRGLYNFYPIFEVQKRLFKELFCKFLTLRMYVRIQDQFIIKSGLWWHAYGILSWF